MPFQKVDVPHPGWLQLPVVCALEEQSAIELIYTKKTSEERSRCVTGVTPKLYLGEERTLIP